MSAPARSLEDVVRAADVDLHAEVRAVFGVGRKQRRHVDDARYAVRVAGFDNLRQLRYIAAVVRYAVLLSGRRREVEADDILAALREFAHDAPADEAVAAGY